MAVSIPANANPAMLAWAREESGYPVGVLAHAIGVSQERFLAWERGERRPTVRQLQALAKRLRRPFGLFFLSIPPSVTALAAEYRRLPGVTPGEESPEFRLAVRVMRYRREAAIELLEELGQPVPELQYSTRPSDAPADVGRRLRSLLGVSIAVQTGWTDEWQAWREWRAAVERAGVLVFQFPGVPLLEVRGVALLNQQLPVIGINSKEGAAAARVFTLLHEFLHLALANAREERPALHDRHSDAEWLAVERFVEAAVGETLVPDDALREAVANRSIRGTWDIRAVRQLAGRFHVTPAAMAVRLTTAGMMSRRQYREWRVAWDEYVATLKPRNGGVSSPAEKALNRAGRPFVQLVLEALDTGCISAVDASRHLELRFDHVEQLRQELRLRPVRAHAREIEP